MLLRKAAAFQLPRVLLHQPRLLSTGMRASAGTCLVVGGCDGLQKLPYLLIALHARFYPVPGHYWHIVQQLPGFLQDAQMKHKAKSHIRTSCCLMLISGGQLHRTAAHPVCRVAAATADNDVGLPAL
jgi:hypothetical protein